MRNLLLTLTLIATMSWGACVWEFPTDTAGHARSPHSSQAAADPWRRTSGGWESRETWSQPTPNHAARIHPMLLASFQLLASIGALLAFGNRGQQRARDWGNPKSSPR